MNLLHLITTLNPELGGVCQALRTSIAGLEKIGVDNSVVCLDDANEEFLKMDSFKIFPLGKGKGPWCHNKNLINWLTENLTNYDAVILHGLWLFPGYALYNVLKKRKYINKYSPALIVMPHGMLDPYFQKAEGRKIKAIRNILYWKMIEKNLVNNADALLFTCEEERNLASTYFSPYKPKKTFIVSLGVPFPSLDSKRFISNTKQKSLLFLSRIHPKKGIDLLVEAYSEIIAEDKRGLLPNLIIAGPGLETEFGNRIYNSVQANSHIKNKISFPGMLIGEAKWEAFFNCEAFILPSHQENFGIAVVEALACGKPVLITDKINIWREIQADEAGIVEADTIDGIKCLIKKWLDFSDKKKKEMGKSALECYTSKFTVEKAASKMYEALSNIIETC